MPVPFKKDPVEFNQRQLYATNIFDLLPKDNYKFFVECFRKSVKIASGLGMLSLGHVGIDG